MTGRLTRDVATGARRVYVDLPDQQGRYYLMDAGVNPQRWLIVPNRHISGLARRFHHRLGRGGPTSFPLPDFFEPPEDVRPYTPPEDEMMPPSEHHRTKDKRFDFELRRAGTAARRDLASYELPSVRDLKGGVVDGSPGGVMLRARGGDATTFELKSELECRNYSLRGSKNRGTVVVEHEDRGEPSGIAVSEADYWALEWLPSRWIVLPRERLKRYWEHFKALPRRAVLCGDEEGGKKVARGVLIGLSELVEEAT